MASIITNLQTTSVINATDTNNGLKPDAFFDKLLLRMIAQTEFKHTKYAVDKKLPRRYGDTINWRRFNALTPNLTPLTEGVTPDGDVISGESITAVINQYGNLIYGTDRVDAEQLDDVKTEYTMELSRNATEVLDEIARNVMINEGSTFFAGGKASAAALEVTDIPVIDDFRKIALGMKTAYIRGNRKANGRYACLVGAETMFDLLDDSQLDRYMDYGNTNRPLANNMIADIYDLRFVEVLNPSILTGVGVGGVNVHQGIVLGEEAYAITKLQGAGVKIITKDLGSAGTEDGLNQRWSIGWKIMGYAVKVLNTEAVVIYHSVPTNN